MIRGGGRREICASPQEDVAVLWKETAEPFKISRILVSFEEFVFWAYLEKICFSWSSIFPWRISFR